MVSILVALGMVLAIAAPAAIAQSAKGTAKHAIAKVTTPVDDLEFSGFEKEREFLDDPREFASDDARQLWEHVVRVTRGTSELFGGMLREGGDFAPLGSQCFLVRYAAIEFTCLGTDDAQILTPWSPPGNTEVISSRALPDGRWWAIVKTGGLSRGEFSLSYHAIFGGNRGGAPFASSKTLASSISSISEDDRLCQSASSDSLHIESAIEAADIQSGPAADRAAFRVLRTDCSTGRTNRQELRYKVSAAGVQPIRQNGSHPLR